MNKGRSKISLEHVCGECRDAFKTAGSLYTHLRDHGYSVEKAHIQYVVAMALEKALGETRNQYEIRN